MSDLIIKFDIICSERLFEFYDNVEMEDDIDGNESD